MFNRNTEMSLFHDFPLHSYTSEHEFITSLDDAFQSLSLRLTNSPALSDPKPKLELKPKSKSKSKSSANDTHTDDTCDHPEILDKKCTKCKKKTDDGYGVPFSYIRKGLRLSHKEIARLRTIESNKLLRDDKKKLVLVLDLDQTLIHVTALEKLGKNSNKSLGVDQFALNSISKLVKLRPFVRPFLKEANKMFEMYVYTTADKTYAMEMVRLLDPEQVYFNSRVISRDDSPKGDQKSLDLVVAPERMVLVLDDTEEVWQNHRPNLVSIERYNYFGTMSDENESETDSVLGRILRLLKLVHALFFHKKLVAGFAVRDVRMILRMVGSEL